MREVMTRPEFLAKFETVTETMIEKYLEQLAMKSVFIRSVPKKFTLSRNRDDEPYINLAIESKADYIVTRDNDYSIWWPDLMMTVKNSGRDLDR